MLSFSYDKCLALTQTCAGVQGVWVARSSTITCPPTFVFDVEGFFGRDRADNAFDAQAALFALAVSDVLIVNMRCTDIEQKLPSTLAILQTVIQVGSRAGFSDCTTWEQASLGAWGRGFRSGPRGGLSSRLPNLAGQPEAVCTRAQPQAHDPGPDTARQRFRHAG